jgi:hypothetical protein
VSLPGFSLPSEIEGLKRSADHKWAFFNANQLYLYSSDTATLSSIPLPPAIADLAVNPTGSQLATISGKQITFYDKNLNVTGTTNASGGFDSGLQYSADGSKLYFEMSNNSFLVDAVNTSTFSETGHITSQYGVQSVAPQLLWVDGSQRAFLSALGGIGTVDATALSTANPSGMIVPQANPPAIPLNTSTPITYSAPAPPAGFVVTFGGVPGVVQSLSPWTVLPPASAVAGPVDVEFTLASGEAFLVPQGFSYGVAVTTPTANLLPNSGNPSVGLFGFGMLNGILNAPPTVTVGGQTVSNVKLNLNSNVLQEVFFLVPSSGAGSADITVSSNNGSGTLKNALTYISSTTVVPSAGLLQLLYDPHRNLLYALKAGEIDVFDPNTLQFQTPVKPGNPTNPNYVSIALTPDGSKMLVTDANNETVTIFNPDNPASNTVVVVSSSAQQAPQQVVTTSTSKAFITTFASRPFELDLGTLALTQRTETFFSLTTKFAATPDGTHMAAASLNNSSGAVAVWNSGSDTFTSQDFIDGFWTDLAISNDGKMIAPVMGFPNDLGTIIAFFDDQLHYINSPVYPDLAFPDAPQSLGAIFSPSGKTFLSPLGDSIDVFDVQTGMLRSRILTPAPIPIINFPLSSSGVVAISPNAQTLYAISTSGLMVLNLPASVDTLPVTIWPFSAQAPVVALMKAQIILDAKARANTGK